jgi:hypothetical protein
VVISDELREVLALPVRMGGLSYSMEGKGAAVKYSESLELTQSIQDAIRAGGGRVDTERVKDARKEIKRKRKGRLENDLKEILGKADGRLKKCIEVASEKGASGVFAVRPLEEFGFSFRAKRDFRDLLRLRYGMEVDGLPPVCACDRPNTVAHTQQCAKGGFIIHRHDEMAKLFAVECKKVFVDVECEPGLDVLEGEEFKYGSANREDEARSDVRVRGFWGNRKNAFFDFRVFYPFAASYFGKSLRATYRDCGKAKKREYEERVGQVEDGSFTPMVMSSAGGMGPEMVVALKYLAARLAIKEKCDYSVAVSVIRCRFSFAAARAALVCLRGSKSLHGNRRYASSRGMGDRDAPVQLVAAEALGSY